MYYPITLSLNIWQTIGIKILIIITFIFNDSYLKKFRDKIQVETLNNK